MTRNAAIAAVIVLVGQWCRIEAQSGRSQVDRSSSQPSTEDVFRAAVQSGLVDETLRIRRPQLFVSPSGAPRNYVRGPHFGREADELDDPKSTIYVFDLGGRDPLALSDATRVPMDYPLSLQCTIEALRKHGNAEFWRRPIALAEGRVQESLKLLATHKGNRSELLKQLARLHTTGYEDLADAVRTYARNNGMVPEETGPGAAPAYYRVVISTNPKGARVYCLDKWTFDTLEKVGASRNYVQWREIGATTNGPVEASLSGRCHFLIWWPEQKRWYTSAAYEISREMTLPFSP